MKNDFYFLVDSLQTFCHHIKWYFCLLSSSPVLPVMSKGIGVLPQRARQNRRNLDDFMVYCVISGFVSIIGTHNERYMLWQFVKNNENAAYACINYGEAFCPEVIEDRSICIDGDIGNVVELLKG